jgi:hypothetical protein
VIRGDAALDAVEQSRSPRLVQHEEASHRPEQGDVIVRGD